MEKSQGFLLRKAHGSDLDAMHALIMEGAEQGLLLPRTKTQLFAALRDFFVAEDTSCSKVAGCCALALVGGGLAEVRSLYVANDYRKKKLGARLVIACLEDAASFGIGQVFSLTYQVPFFTTLGFKEILKETLPQKIWTDCINCPKFPNCDEVAMIRSV